MPAETKEIGEGALNCQNPVGLAGRFEPASLAFSLARGVMRDFRSIVETAVLGVTAAW